jgi:hypothetical protein
MSRRADGASGFGGATGPIVTALAAPSLAEIHVRGTIALSVTAIDAQGKPTPPPSLSSSSPGVATISGDVVTGLAPGMTAIQYTTSAGPITVATIDVVAAGTPVSSTSPASLSVLPALMSLPLHATGTIAAHAYSLAGSSIV